MAYPWTSKEALGEGSVQGLKDDLLHGPAHGREEGHGERVAGRESRVESLRPQEAFH